MQADQAEHQRLEILHQIVEHPQPLGILTLVDVDQRSYLGRLERDVLRPKADFEFLPPVLVLLRPFRVVLSV